MVMLSSLPIDMLPFKVAGTFGVYFEGTPLVCGGDNVGYTTNQCFKYKNHTWTQVRRLPLWPIFKGSYDKCTRIE